MQLLVTPQPRFAKMRAHTATHLLHFALDHLLQGTKQAGSLVDDDYLRFDFACKKPLTPQDIHHIEQQVNKWISDALPVDIQEMSYNDALAHGAKAFFEDKYGDTVRVITIQHNETGDEPTYLTSIELCGGTHVHNTQDIGCFKITGQASVASGIRRITAITGTKLLPYTQDLENTLGQLARQLDCQPGQVEEKLGKILTDYTSLQDTVSSLQGQQIQAALQQASTSTTPAHGFDIVINLSQHKLDQYDFKTLVYQAKQLWPERNWVMFTDAGNFGIFTGSGATEFTAKSFAQQHKLKGGGSDQFVQGRDEKVTNIF